MVIECYQWLWMVIECFYRWLLTVIDDCEWLSMIIERIINGCGWLLGVADWLCVHDHRLLTFKMQAVILFMYQN